MSAIVAALLAPSVNAGWSGKGNYEPDTARDTIDGWMTLDPDTVPTDASPRVRTVYFNGFIGQASYPTSTSIAPNLGALRSGMGNPHFTTFTLLGVWKDCNDDGYVGLGDNALFEYRAELLGTSAICKAEATPDPIPPGWFPSHNDGQWVREYLPLSWSPWNGPDPNPYNIHDNASRVWYDFNRPDAPPATTCWLNPHPRGTYHSVGGILFTYDCYDDYRVTDTLNTGFATLGRPDLGFGDHPRDQYNSDSPLNVKNPWGEESDASAVQAWDCSEPQLAQVSAPNPTGGTVYVANVSEPQSPPSVSPGSGSAAGTMNATGSGLDQCARRSDGAGGRGGTAARVPYALEGDVTQAAVKRQPDGELSPRQTERGTAWHPTFACVTQSGVTVCTPPEARPDAGPLVAQTLGPGTPRDGGLRDGFAAGSNFTFTDGFWGENVVWIDSLLVGLDGSLAAPEYMTFYAYVSPAAVSAHGLTLPKGTATGTYGFEHCGTAIGVGEPERLGWDCDPTRWYRDANGNDAEERSAFLGPTPGVPIGARAGAPFNLRDVDCRDESIGVLRDEGISWGLVTNEPCF